MYNCLGKLFTSILNNRLKKKKVPQQNILISVKQVSHQTIAPLIIYIFTLPTLIDFKKAFDQVFHDGHLYELLQYNINGRFYDLINGVCSRSNCSITIDNQRTEFFNYHEGVHKRCKLSPMLFNMYLNEIPFLIDRNETDPIILPNGTRLTSLLHAKFSRRTSKCYFLSRTILA